MWHYIYKSLDLQEQVRKYMYTYDLTPPLQGTEGMVKSPYGQTDITTSRSGPHAKVIWKTMHGGTFAQSVVVREVCT